MPPPPPYDPDALPAAELLELGDAFFELDPQWRIVRVNRNQERLSAKPRSETLGRVFWEVWPDTAAPDTLFWREYHRCMEERVPVQFEDHYAPLDLWTGVTAYPVSTGGIAVFFRDVTAMKEAEQRLRRSEERFRSVVENMSEGLMLFDSARNLVYQNPASLRIHGFDPEADGRLGREEVPATWNAWDEAGRPITFDEWPVSRVFRGERFQHQVLRVERVETGRIFHGSYNGSPIFDADGTLVLGFITIRDVTGPKRAEEALRRSEEALRQANERLRDSDRRKDDFLGMLSHELRNPLAPIRNSLYVLDHAEPNGHQARRAKEIASRQVGHLTRLVDDLLDVTRIARGKIELRRATLDLGTLARLTAEDYRPLMHERGLALEVTAPDERLPVDGDETRLAQVLGNLLSNAAKFTPAGGRVSLEAEGSGGRALVRVRDTGVGLTPDLAPTIFEPFVQAKQTLARSEGGLGLGLALVRGLTELHGGRVSVTSDGPGAGTTFTVELPVAESLPATPPPRRGAGTRRACRVLVVDDNVDAAESLAELVRLFGHEVEIAHDGPGAVATAAALRPDVVLCDLGLPGMDGYEIAKALRDRLDGDVQLVAVSGYAQLEDVERSAAAGFDAHVAKPPDPARLEQLFG